MGTEYKLKRRHTMNKVRIKGKKEEKKKLTAQDLKVGQIGEILDNVVQDYNGDYIMRTHRGFVSLSTAGTWDDVCILSLSHILQPGEVVEITIGE